MKKKLIVTVGLPRSGKSTWAMKYSEQTNTPIVNPDSLRLALHGQTFLKQMEPYVWALSKTMVETLFNTGYKSVIIDATHTKKPWRKQWKSKKWDVVFVVFNTPVETCLDRAKNTDKEYLIPVIKRMAKEFQEVTKEEGKIYKF